MRPYTLHNGDCLEIMPTLKSKSIDLILCDLPYGTMSVEWDNVIPFDKLWAEYKRLIKDGCAIVLFATNPFTIDLINSNRSWFRYSWIWDKQRTTNHLLCNIKPMPRTEDIVVFGKTGVKYNPQLVKKEKPVRDKTTASGNTKLHGKYGKDHRVYERVATYSYPSNIITCPTVPSSKNMHPTQKPTGLLEYLIKTYTDKGAVVLDNCMGSGSTGIASLNSNRSFIGIEQDKDYFYMAEKRIKAFSG